MKIKNRFKKTKKRIILIRIILMFSVLINIGLIGAGSYCYYNFHIVKEKLEIDFYANKTQVLTSDRFKSYLDKTQTKEEFVSHNGKKIAYSIMQLNNEKKNTTIFIVGGLPGIDIHWADFTNEVKSQANVIVLHPSGYQPSEGIRTTSNIIDSTHVAYRAIMDRYELWNTRKVFIGESMGGNVIAHLSQSFDSEILILHHPMPSVQQAAGYNIVKLDGKKEDTIPYIIYDFIGNPKLENMLPKTKSKNGFMTIGEKDTITDPKDQLAAYEATVKAGKSFRLLSTKDDDHWSTNINQLVQMSFYGLPDQFSDNKD